MPERARPSNPLGFSTLGTPAWSLSRVLAEAHAWGCGCVELRLLDGAIVTPDTADALIDAAAEQIRGSGLFLTALASSIRLFDAEKADAEFPSILSIAARLGARRVRVFSGPETGAGLKADVARAADVLRRALPKAHGHGIGIALETHHALSGAAPVACLLDQVPDEAFGVIWDPVYTWMTGDTPQDAWAALGSRTVEIQVKDVVRSGEKFKPRLLGEGDMPWAENLMVALADGFSGPIVAEWEKHWHPDIAEPEVAIPQHLRAIRDLTAAG